MKSETRDELMKLDLELARFQDIAKPTKTDLAKMEQTLFRYNEITTEDTITRAATALDEIRAPMQPKPPQPQPGMDGGYCMSGDSTRAFGEFLQNVYCAGTNVDPGQRIGRFETGRVDREILYGRAEAAGLEESLPSGGGFAVGSDMATEIFTRAYQRSILWSRCREFPISSNSNSIKIPGIDEESRANGSRQGGVTSYWQSEASEKATSKPKFNAVEMSLKKLIGLCYTTDELLEDASLLGAFIGDAFEREFSFRLDDAVLNGSGTGQPLGINNAAALVAVSGASSANTLTSTDVLKCYARLWPGSENDSIWIANRDTVPEMMSMSSGDIPLWLPASSLAGRPHQTLLGRPLFFVEQASSVGTKGDLMLLDLSQYGIATKGGIQAATSIHVKFSSDETAFRFVLRVDGQPLWSTAVTPYKGTDSQSPFVTVDTRS